MKIRTQESLYYFVTAALLLGLGSLNWLSSLENNIYSLPNEGIGILLFVISLFLIKKGIFILKDNQS